VVPGAWWYADVAASAGQPRRLISIASTRHRDGARVPLTAEQVDEQAGADAACLVTYGWDDQVHGLQVTKRTAPSAPPLWFLEIRESSAQPPAVNLLAFSGHGMPAGMLVDLAGFSNVDADGSDQLGALRWYPASGEVDQIYVQPEWRRRTIGNALLIAAGALSVARDWPRLWGDGQRTDLGERFRNESEWRDRAADLTHVAPPMTPPMSSPMAPPMAPPIPPS
jgi:GNAT superfamily N-acetyltransferase